ncbi:YaaC family protein [Flavobacterium anhuiense]|uniref:YaaC family protein n=1 Tax=Flavobacterium anhuiense TaxID=459526 RepID=UPI000E6B56AA|nr:YaaC family protein [Flavobacterium anhuiense]
MNNTWHFLREFESKDLIKQYIKKKYQFTLSSEKALETNSAFKQARSYFESSLNADISVKPVLQYYGVVALSRGLILILDKIARESNIKPSHGLKISNWSAVAKNKKLEDIKIKTSSGTFKELIEATKNVSYFRGSSNYINFQSEFDISESDYEINFKELSYSFPDLKKSIESWLGETIPSVKMESLGHKDGITNIGVRELTYIKDIFPENIFSNIKIEHDGHRHNVSYEGDNWPNISQKWESSFQINGDPYLQPPFTGNIIINEIGKMFAVSFILGTISRYYPTTWMNITNGIEDDRILPFAINFMDLIQEKFPRVILDFLDAPYDND